MLERKMWDAYAKQAGGVTFDGKPLPTWDELGEERQVCWKAAASVCADEIERLQGEVMAWWKEAELMRSDLAHYSAALQFIAMAKPLGGQTWEDHAKEMTDYAIKALERRGLPND